MAMNTSINTPYLVLTGIVLIAIVFLFAVTQPQIDSINTLRNDIAQNTNILTEKQNLLQSLGSRVQQLQTQPDAERQLAVVIPETDQTQDIVRVIDQYATQAGITTVSIANNSVERQAQIDANIARGEEITTPSDVRTLSFQLEVGGSYPQLREFLKLLEKSPRIIDVIRMSVKQVAQQPGQVTATLVLQSYAQQTDNEFLSQ